MSEDNDNAIETLKQIKEACTMTVGKIESKNNKPLSKKPFSNGMHNMANVILLILNDYEKIYGEIPVQKYEDLQAEISLDQEKEKVENLEYERVENLKKSLKHQFRDLNEADKKYYDIYHFDVMATGVKNDKFVGVLYYDEDVLFDLDLSQTRRLCADFAINKLSDDELIEKYDLNNKQILMKIKYTWAYSFFDHWFNMFDERLEEYTKFVNNNKKGYNV